MGEAEDDSVLVEVFEGDEVVGEARELNRQLLRLLPRQLDEAWLREAWPVGLQEAFSRPSAACPAFRESLALLRAAACESAGQGVWVAPEAAEEVVSGVPRGRDESACVGAGEASLPHVHVSAGAVCVVADDLGRGPGPDDAGVFERHVDAC